MDWRRALNRALSEPGFAFSVALQLVRGHYYRVKFKALRRRVVIGRRFRVSGRLDIRGPGTVIFGDDCGVVSTRIAPTTPYTHAKDAVLRFGNRVLLTGARIGCQERIEVADGAGVAEARVLDTDFHTTEVTDQLRYNTTGVSKPIFIGRNAWIAPGSIVLKGVKVGENSIVGAGAVVVASVPENTVVMGNPARVVWRMKSRRSPLDPPEREAASADDAAADAPGAHRVTAMTPTR